MRFGFDVDASPDFFSGFPSAGEAINAPTARQLRKIEPLVFMILSSLFIPISQSAAQVFAGRDANARLTSILGLARRTSDS
jgi:hypothetical protein